MAKINFNSGAYKPAEEFEVLPKGEYPMAVTNSGLKPTRDGTGERLEVTYTILEGRYKNRKIIGGFNMKNKSQEAVDISNRQMSALTHAVGLGGKVIDDSVEWHNKPFLGVVDVKPASGAYGPSNEVKGWKPLSGQVSTTSRPPFTDDNGDEDRPSWG